MAVRTGIVPRAETASPVVTTTADTVADDGEISLREAINYANANPGTTISFNIPSAQAVGGVFTISPGTALPDIAADGTIIDGSTQTAFTGDTNTAGPEIVISGVNDDGTADANGANGLRIVAANCAVKNLLINSWINQGLWLATGATNTTVQGCVIGLEATGTTAAGNGSYGLLLDGGTNHNTIGGTTAAARNVVAGNHLDIRLNNAGYNTIEGNYVGLQVGGDAAPINHPSDTFGIRLREGSAHNQIGGTDPGAGNVVVAYGVATLDSGSALAITDAGSDYNVVQGNFVGTNKDGTMAVGTSSYGILCTGTAQFNFIGGATAAARNVVSAHPEFGIAASFANNNTFQGNYVGTNVTGTQALGSGLFGVVVYACTNTLVGGATTGTGNVVSGNFKRVVLIESEPGVDPTDDNTVQGNYIGTDPTGTMALGTQTTGVAIEGKCHRNVIGLALDGSGAPNIIAYNGADTAFPLKGGVVVYSSDASEVPSGNTIRGNTIYGNGNNGGLGINLQPVGEAENTVTPNDAQDTDGDANNLQNFPIITSAMAATNTLVSGTLNSTPNRSFIIDLYRNTAADASGYGEGQAYLGAVNVTTDNNGDASFNYSASGNFTGQYVTATATDAVTGDTSEFSADATVAPQPFTIGGRIVDSGGAALANVSVTRSGSGTPVVSDSNGNYSFTNVIAGTYTLTPSKTGYAFSPATRNVTVSNANINNQNFTGYNSTLSGRIAFSDGTGIVNAQVKLNTGRSVLTNSAGYYTFTAMLPGAYTVTPVLAGYSFDPAYRPVTIGNSSIGNINFTGGYTISGRIADSSGNAIVNQAVTRTGSSSSVTTNSAGYYSFYGVANGTYTVTPTAGTYGFTPPSRNVTVNGASVSGQNFSGTTGYTVTGRIADSRGMAIAGVTVSRTGSVATATTNSAGYYTFNGVPNGTYTLTPSKSGYTFTPATKSVTVSGANVSGQNFIGS
jgi:CSLREA domain-containing protein